MCTVCNLLKLSHDLSIDIMAIRTQVIDFMSDASNRALPDSCMQALASTINKLRLTILDQSKIRFLPTGLWLDNLSEVGKSDEILNYAKLINAGMWLDFFSPYANRERLYNNIAIHTYFGIVAGSIEQQIYKQAAYIISWHSNDFVLSISFMGLRINYTYLEKLLQLGLRANCFTKVEQRLTDNVALCNRSSSAESKLLVQIQSVRYWQHVYAYVAQNRCDVQINSDAIRINSDYIEQQCANSLLHQNAKLNIILAVGCRILLARLLNMLLEAKIYLPCAAFEQDVSALNTMINFLDAYEENERGENFWIHTDDFKLFFDLSIKLGEGWLVTKCHTNGASMPMHDAFLFEMKRKLSQRLSFSNIEPEPLIYLTNPIMESKDNNIRLGNQV